MKTHSVAADEGVSALAVSDEAQGDVTQRDGVKRKVAASPQVEKDVKREKSE